MFDLYIYLPPLIKVALFFLVVAFIGKCVTDKKVNYYLLAIVLFCCFVFWKVYGTYEPKNTLNTQGFKSIQGQSPVFKSYNKRIEGFKERENRLQEVLK